MEVTKNTPVAVDVAPRRMTQKLTKSLLDQGLISIDEYDRITTLNREKFYPFYGDLMQK